MPQYVAYYRVSTDKQGIKGLGMDAQREAVSHFIAGKGELAAQYIEVESGRKNDRPQLHLALAECRKRRAVLVIAKLDRLGRNVAFISALMDGGVDFLCCDNPHTNRLMLHMLAAFAEHEREQISQRTKAALAAAKARGTKLGNPRAAEAAVIAREAKGIQPPAPEVLRLMTEWKQQGMRLREIPVNLTG